MSNKSGVASQVLSLPTGGGAMQGIGETFSPDLFTGTGNFNVPITLPPGRSGYKPDIRLNYSSGNGNGPFGFGWSINTPTIARKTSKGVPTYQNYGVGEKSDTFILTGTDDLVPVGDVDTGITRYRPRTEGLFALIDHHHDAEVDFWKVRTKDGHISHYGKINASNETVPVIANPLPDQRHNIAIWLVSRTEDAFGNHVLYEYARDPITPRPISEDSAVREWEARYIKRILYGNYEQNGETKYLVSVDFLYEEREDAFSAHRTGFEIRTKYRCKRIEVSTHADESQLFRAYDLKYNAAHQGHNNGTDLLPLNGVSLLTQVAISDAESKELIPPLMLNYSPFKPDSSTLRELGGDNAPQIRLSGPDTEIVDLFGNGLPDIVRLNGDAKYWRNKGDGVFSDGETFPLRPIGASLGNPGVAFADMNGNGRADLLVQEQGGYFQLGWDGAWGHYIRERQLFDLGNGEVRFLDIDGDGVADAMQTGTELEIFCHDPISGWYVCPASGWPEDDVRFAFSDHRIKIGDMTGDGLLDVIRIRPDWIEFWPNQGHGNWGRRVRMLNPPLHNDDESESLGALYDRPDRVMFGDVDGDGLDDIIFVGQGTVIVWINQSGNGWSRPIRRRFLPRYEDVDDIRVADMLGQGTDGVLWSYAPRERPREVVLAFLDFTSGLKPYLLTGIDNQIGAKTVITYAPSTKFYCSDQDTDCQWQSRLPSPVHVVERTDVTDEITQRTLTTEYVYHHGFWDGLEREFRGFGMVEQLDTERKINSGAEGQVDGPSAADALEPHQSPPMLTKRWFHVGAVGDEYKADKEFAARIEADFSTEYWEGDEFLLERTDDTPQLLALLAENYPRQHADALRSLRGRELRMELFAKDGTSREMRPYLVSESVYGIRLEVKPDETQSNQSAVFFPYTIAQRTTTWERGDDAMTTFNFVGDYDDFGQPMQETSVALPRRSAKRQAAQAARSNEAELDETRILATHTRTAYASPTDASYIRDRVAGTSVYELADPPALTETDPDDTQSLLRDQYVAALNVESMFQDAFYAFDPARPGDSVARLIAHSVNYYDGGAFEGKAHGTVGSYGALVRTEELVLTEEILEEAYNGSDAVADSRGLPPYFTRQPLGAEYPDPFDAIAQQSDRLGYVRFDGSDGIHVSGHYVTSARHCYDFQATDEDQRGTIRAGATARSEGVVYGLLKASLDPLDGITSIDYDECGLLPTKVTDAVGLCTEAEYDYRVMKPSLVKDPNDNRQVFGYTPLGLLGSVAVMGKVGETFGDTVDAAGIKYHYDFLAYARDGRPISVRTVRRVHHVTDLDVHEPERSDSITTCEYSDGFGRLVQTRTQAEDVKLAVPEATNVLTDNNVLPICQSETEDTRKDVIGVRRDSGSPMNVVVSGWQIYDNKGRVVEKYEPFYSTGFGYAQPEEHQMGQKVTQYYDPLGRVVRTVNPNGSEQRTIIGVPGSISVPNIAGTFQGREITFEPTPWEVFTYDANDLAPLISDSLPNGEEVSLSNRAPAHHHFTPSSQILDALGRTLVSIERNSEWSQEDEDYKVTEYRVRNKHDIRGNLISITDQLGRHDAFKYIYDLADRPIRTESIDAGVRRVVVDAAGNEIERRDGKGSLVVKEYDTLHRPIRLWARDGVSDRITLREYLKYGDAISTDSNPVDHDEAIADAKAANLLGRLSQHYDEAGLLTFERYDFKGNIVEKNRQVIRAKQILSVFPATDASEGWNIQPFVVDWQRNDLEPVAVAREILNPRVYQTTVSYDALSRVKTAQYPKDVEGNRKILRPVYNRAGALEQVTLYANAEAMDRGDGKAYVQHIAYNAKGQRTLIAYGNGIITRYAYDSRTFHLTRVRIESFTPFDNGSDSYRFVAIDKPLQDTYYSYDLVGNIVGIEDQTPGNGLPSQPNRLFREFEYDSVYRLTHATGREHAGGRFPDPWSDQPKPQDITRTQGYTETYSYDSVGNMLWLRHTAHNSSNLGGFKRSFKVDDTNNRLNMMTVDNGADRSFNYRYDANGNMVKEGLDRHFEWNHGDRLKSFRVQPDRAKPSIHGHYLYDASGQRVMKLIRTQGGSYTATIYVDSSYVHFTWNSKNGHGVGENFQLNLANDQQIVASVKVGDLHPEDSSPSVQYYLTESNHCSQVCVGDDGRWINREEYTPYGESAFGGFSQKRYRYVGKERDKASGLYYFGARYFMPWQGRWISCDPSGPNDGVNLYPFSRNNPITYTDTDGRQSTSATHGLYDVIPYRTRVKNRSKIGQNVQKDHVIAQEKIKMIRTDPEGNIHYSPREDPTVIVETGAAQGSVPAKPHTLKTFHDTQSDVKEISRLREEGISSISGDIVEPSRNAALRSGYNPESVDKAILGQLDNLHSQQTLSETAETLMRLERALLSAEKLHAKLLKRALRVAVKGAPVVGVFFGLQATAKAAERGDYDQAAMEALATVYDPADWALTAVAVGELAKATHQKKKIESAIHRIKMDTDPEYKRKYDLEMKIFVRKSQARPYPGRIHF